MSSSQADSMNQKMEGGAGSSGDKKPCPAHTPGSGDTKRGFRKSRHNDYVKISMKEPEVNRLPPEWWKTTLLFFYAGLSLVLTTVVITVVHERVPPKESIPPLPDTFFEYIDRVKWAFTVTEVNGIVLVTIWFLQLFFFNHKSIVCRRYFFLLGTLYLYRCVTMYITILPVPGMHFSCAPKLYGDSYAKFQRILKLISGAGLSITSSHIMCGDFLFSGHTVMLTLTYLFIKEYSPRSFWWYHLMCWLLSAVGVVCILVAHEHYSVDVVVGYFVTTRLFWWYHSMANTQCECSPNNYFTNTWWNPLFNFMERNVNTPVPRVYGWPISWAPACLKNPCAPYLLVLYQRSEGSSMTEDSATQPTGDRVMLIGLNSLNHEGQALRCKSSEVASRALSMTRRDDGSSCAWRNITSLVRRLMYGHCDTRICDLPRREFGECS
ncbi:phosphatidylcholine:ceramide cholinephosphotransferase 2 [Hippocampus zosterae]|uniref:phosphatidylcholine:ceramide cholinephosphotransferase 2 n=1 Tax=Hippocampus zosterae TaxID=109293 RepID=UPI00223D3222|nr:phosphatidylcholine:ceramide cholinephosphotransferase 2 [Hippocampus zosterae]